MQASSNAPNPETPWLASKAQSSLPHTAGNTLTNDLFDSWWALIVAVSAAFVIVIFIAG
jgi:hypothetical protein